METVPAGSYQVNGKRTNAKSTSVRSRTGAGRLPRKIIIGQSEIRPIKPKKPSAPPSAKQPVIIPIGTAWPKELPTLADLRKSIDAQIALSRK